MQPRPAVLVGGFHVGPGLHEQRDAARIARYGNVKSRASALVDRLRVGPRGKQSLHQIGLVVLHSAHQQRCSVRVGGLGVGSGGKQRGNDRRFRLAGACGQRQSVFPAAAFGIHVGTGSDQLIDDGSVTFIDGFHQRRFTAAVGSVDIRAVFDEQIKRLRIAGFDGFFKQAGRLVGGHGFQIGAGGDQGFDSRQVLTIDGIAQGGQAFGIGSVTLCPAFQKQLDRLGRCLAVAGGGHQRRAAFLVSGVDVRLRVQKHFDHLGHSGTARASHQRRDAIVGGGVHVSTGVQQRFHDLGIFVRGRAHQRGDAALGALVDTGAGFQQLGGDGRVFVGSCGDQGRLPAFARSVGVSTGGQQRLHGLKRVVGGSRHQRRFFALVARFEVGAVFERRGDLVCAPLAAQLVEIVIAQRAPGGDRQADQQERGQKTFSHGLVHLLENEPISNSDVMKNSAVVSGFRDRTLPRARTLSSPASRRRSPQAAATRAS